MKDVHGFTWHEVITAILVVTCGLLFLVLIVHPGRQLAKERDVQREQDVEDIMQAVIELSASDQESFARLFSFATEQEVMIGTGASCAGSYGRHCNDIILRDACLHPDTYGLTPLLEEVPVDPLSKYFSDEHTGYYVYVENNVLEVGACQTSFEENIALTWDLGRN